MSAGPGEFAETEVPWPTCCFEWPAATGQLHYGPHLCFEEGQHDVHVCGCGAQFDGKEEA